MEQSRRVIGLEAFHQFRTTSPLLYEYKNLARDEVKNIGHQTVSLMFQFADYKAGLLDIVTIPQSRPVSNPQSEQVSNPQVEAVGSPQVEAVGSPKVETDFSPKVETTSIPEKETVPDFLEDLVNLQVASSPKLQSFPAEETLYSFEQLIHPAQDEKNVVEVETLPVLERRPNSERGSTQGSDSVITKQQERVDRKTNFGVLQDHINTLTEENCELRRALELQQRLTGNLTAENQHLGDEYNSQGQKLEELQSKCAHYETLLQEQHETLETLAKGHEASRSAEQGAQQRIKVLVQENIGLEDKLRDVRVSEIRLQKTVETYKSELEDFKKRQSHLQNENKSLTDILHNIREENNLLRSQIHPIQKEVKNMVTKMDASCQADLEPLAMPSSSQDNAQNVTNDEILASLSLADLPILNPEENVVLSSVHELLDALEEQRKAMFARLRVSKDEINQLKAENTRLDVLVSNQNQQLEQVLQQQSTKAGPHPKSEKTRQSGGQGWFAFQRGRNAQNLLD